MRSGLARGAFSFELIEPVARRTGVADAAFARGLERKRRTAMEGEWRREDGGGRTARPSHFALRTPAAGPAADPGAGVTMVVDYD